MNKKDGIIRMSNIKSRYLFIIVFLAFIIILGTLFFRFRPAHYPYAYLLTSNPANPWAFCAEDTDVQWKEKQWLDCTIGIERYKIFETHSTYSEVEKWYQGRYKKIGGLQLNKTGLELVFGSKPELIDVQFKSYISMIWEGESPKYSDETTPYFVLEKYSLYIRFAYKDTVFWILAFMAIFSGLVFSKIKKRSRPTKRAPDAWDSAQIPSSFLRLFIFLVGWLRRPLPQRR